MGELAFPFLLSLLVSWTASSYGADHIVENDLAKICRPLDRNLDLLFVLDGSGSTGGNTFQTQKDMVHRIIDLVDITPNKTKVAIIQYSGYTRLEWDFSSHETKEELIEALDGIRHISGTTKTGKALEKAMETFTSEYGARLRNQNIAQVAIVVSDGHSHDDPVPAAERLRRLGVTILSVGIGDYINMNELVDIAASEDLAFRNDTLDEFVEAFRQIAIGQKCDFIKGSDGAEIKCLDDRVEIDILTKYPFQGHLYVPRFFGFRGCTASASRHDDKSVSLSIPLDRCGIEKQFLFKPRGLLFETSVVLKFHPEYHTLTDKTFPVRCFYPDYRAKLKADGDSSNFKQAENKTQVSFSLDSFNAIRNIQKVQELPLVSSDVMENMELPCIYFMSKNKDNDCLLENLNVGDTARHVWKCDQNTIGDNYGMLVHSCYMTDGLGKELRVLDENGCSLDTTVLPTPIYADYLVAYSDGGVVKYADHPMMQFRCSLRFCNKQNGECEQMLPPYCGDQTADIQEANNVNSRIRRQAVPAHTLPPHFMERLFARRKFYEDAAANKNKVPKEDVVIAVTPDTADAQNFFSTDDNGRANLQTIEPMVKIQPVRRRPMNRPRKLKPAYPKPKVESTEDSASSQNFDDVLNGEFNDSDDGFVPVSNLERRIPALKLRSRKEDSKRVEFITLPSVVAADNELNVAEDENLASAAQNNELFRDESSEKPVLEWDGVIGFDLNPSTSAAPVVADVKEKKVENPVDFITESPTVGTTPWHWVQVNGRWVREGIWPPENAPKPKDQNDWVLIDGEWERKPEQEFSIDDSKEQMEMFENYHKTKMTNGAGHQTVNSIPPGEKEGEIVEEEGTVREGSGEKPTPRND